MRANWDDLNIPARTATLAAAALPMIQYDNTGHLVATQSLVRTHDLGIFFTSIENLAEQLHDTDKLHMLKSHLKTKRELFTFDYHVPDLVEFFKKVIKRKRQ